MKLYTEREAIADALRKYPDCTFASCENGLDYAFRATIVVNLWRDYGCYMHNDPPKYKCEGYLRKEG